MLVSSPNGTACDVPFACFRFHTMDVNFLTVGYRPGSIEASLDKILLRKVSRAN